MTTPDLNAPQSESTPVTQRKVSSFAALWSSTLSSNLADGVFKLALPLLATRLTDSPALVAGVAFAVRLPWLLFALPVGALVAGLLAGFASLPLIYVTALLLGIAETVADTAGSSVLPSFVAPADLER